MTGIVKSYQDLEVRAYQDPLTGLYNRRFLEEAVADLLPSLSQVGFVLFDLTAFKGINDTDGHETGDLALCYVADALTESLPLGSIIVRLGG